MKYKEQKKKHLKKTIIETETSSTIQPENYYEKHSYSATMTMQ